MRSVLVWPNFISSAVSVAPSISHFAFCSTTPKAEKGQPWKNSPSSRASDGFVIAEADLRLRGPGDILGTAQTGLPPLKLGDLFRDVQLMKETAALAAEVFADDPELRKSKHRFACIPGAINRKDRCTQLVRCSKDRT